LVKYAKTILLDTQYTHQDRQILEPLIDELIGKKIIRIHAPKGSSDPRNVADIITDFLTRAFIHARRQLEAMQVFATGCIIQFVMTVPTIWKPQSSRILQDSIAASIKASGFGTLDQGCVDNLIIISEPEAAATYLMSSSKTMLVRLQKFKLLTILNDHARLARHLCYWIVGEVPSTLLVILLTQYIH